MARTPIFNNPLPESADLIKRQDVLDLSNNMETKAMAAAQYDGDGAVKAAGGIAAFNAEALAVWKEHITNLLFPVGALYFSAANTNPSQYLGGTWVAWGAGRVPVGVNTADANFNTPEKTGGAKTHKHLQTVGQNTNAMFAALGTTSEAQKTGKIIVCNGTYYENHPNIVLAHTHDESTLQPYITCYMWKRTA